MIQLGGGGQLIANALFSSHTESSTVVPQPSFDLEKFNLENIHHPYPFLTLAVAIFLINNKFTQSHAFFS